MKRIPEPFTLDQYQAWCDQMDKEVETDATVIEGVAMDLAAHRQGYLKLSQRDICNLVEYGRDAEENIAAWHDFHIEIKALLRPY